MGAHDEPCRAWPRRALIDLVAGECGSAHDHGRRLSRWPCSRDGDLGIACGLGLVRCDLLLDGRWRRIKGSPFRRRFGDHAVFILRRSWSSSFSRPCAVPRLLSFRILACDALGRDRSPRFGRAAMARRLAVIPTLSCPHVHGILKIPSRRPPEGHAERAAMDRRSNCPPAASRYKPRRIAAGRGGAAIATDRLDAGRPEDA